MNYELTASGAEGIWNVRVFGADGMGPVYTIAKGILNESERNMLLGLEHMDRPRQIVLALGVLMDPTDFMEAAWPLIERLCTEEE